MRIALFTSSCILVYLITIWKISLLATFPSTATNKNVFINTIETIVWILIILAILSINLKTRITDQKKSSLAFYAIYVLVIQTAVGNGVIDRNPLTDILA